MQFVSCHNGRLYLLKQREEVALLGAAKGETGEKTFTTGLRLLDELLPNGVLARGAVHEVLADPREGTPLMFALLLAKAAAGERAVVGWGPVAEVIPPRLVAEGGAPERRFFLCP